MQEIFLMSFQSKNQKQHLKAFHRIIQMIHSHHKLHGSQFDNNSCVKLDFHKLIDMDVIHLFVLFEYQCCVHCLNTNVICLFILFKYICCMCIYVVYTQKLCTQLLCLNNAQHSCLNNMNLWNNKFHMTLEWIHEACKSVMHNNSYFTSHIFLFSSSSKVTITSSSHSLH